MSYLLKIVVSFVLVQMVEELGCATNVRFDIQVNNNKSTTKFILNIYFEYGGDLNLGPNSEIFSKFSQMVSK